MKTFGADSFSGFTNLLPTSTVEDPDPYVTQTAPAQPDYHQGAIVNELLAQFREISVLGEIVRRVIPLTTDDAGAARHASKGEFSDIKAAIAQELFAPKSPANELKEELDALRNELASIKAKLDAPATEETAKPAKEKKNA